MESTFTPQQNAYFDKLLGSPKQVSQSKNISVAKTNADRIRAIGTTSTTQTEGQSESNYLPENMNTAPKSSFRYDAPLSHEEKLVKYQNEANVAQQKSNETNSVGGIISNTLKNPAMTNTPVLGGVIGLSQTANKAIDNPFDRETNNIKMLSDTNLHLQKRIKELDASGGDSSRLKKLYNENADEIDKSTQNIDQANKDLPTTGNVVGQGLRTLLDVASVGTFKNTGGMTSGKLATNASNPAVVATAEQIAKQKAGLFTAQGAKNVLGATLKGAAYAYPYDTAIGLEGKRGEEREGVKSLIPGKITAMGGILAAGLAAGKASINSVQNTVAEHKVNVAQRADKLAGQIAQGDAKDIPKVKSAISQIDTEGVKTYKDLSKKMNDKITESAEALDKTLETNTDKNLLDDFTLDEKVGDKNVTHNYIKDGIDKLKELYTKTNDPVSLEKVTQFENKALNEGITVKEANDFSRDFGNEFSQKAFSKSGEPLTSVNAVSLENIRSGIKATARDFFDNPVYAEADKHLSDLIQTRSLVDNMAEKVNDLQQKIQPMGWGQKTGRLIGKIIDTVSGGGVKGFVSSFVPRGSGYKTLNPLDLQASLQKNLSKLSDILEKTDMPEETVQKELQGVLDGLLTKNTAVASQLENAGVTNIPDFTQTVEGEIENAGGWKIEGMKKVFDDALRAKDALTVKALINQKAVPEEYLTRFAEDIAKILKKK